MTRTPTILVLGASGMLGHTVLRYLKLNRSQEVIGTVRSQAAVDLLPQPLRTSVVSGIDVQDVDGLTKLFAQVRPVAVINCVGLVKQRASAAAALEAIPINSLLPHRLLDLCRRMDARLIHISTDCVFAGTTGMYREDDAADARDLYGRSKLLGEVQDPQALTLRTSIIGPELHSAQGLLCWFLSQRTGVKGFTRAFFSGLTTLELARVLCDVVLPRPRLSGLYHVAGERISKYDLLCLIGRVYGHGIEIEPSADLAIDRSLDAHKFLAATGYAALPWRELVRAMHEFG